MHSSQPPPAVIRTKVRAKGAGQGGVPGLWPSAYSSLRRVLLAGSELFSCPWGFPPVIGPSPPPHTPLQAFQGSPQGHQLGLKEKGL